MELKTGVNLHIINEKKFKTVQFLIRFRTKMSRQNVAKRVIISNLWETSNAVLTTNQQLQRKLSDMYGASLSTGVAKKGNNHFLNLAMSVVNPKFVGTDTVMDAIELLHQTIFMPFIDGEIGFDEATFAREKKNLLQYLASTREDKSYVASTRLSELFFSDSNLATPSISNVGLMEQETRQSVFDYYRKMLLTDTIDIMVLGDFTASDEARIEAHFAEMPFTDRAPLTDIFYQQAASNVVREKTEQEDVNQSILQLAYHQPVRYGDADYLALQVLNGVLGGFSHSKLFTNVREKESLAYYANSRFDSFTGFLKISAGIDASNRSKALSIIRDQVRAISTGDISDEELRQTKDMLRNNYFLAQDSPSNLIEQAFIQHLLPKETLSAKEWVKKLDAITVEDVVKVAKTLNLQALYFMEGDALGN
ncbi:EF-P 5-aminopentanol modification-associated protein YfmF [Lactococcus insecticola]|uniref:Peptidase M16 n=1 Tax=Pseudolactococcus insecticola TaxID=2709158 RepID=A0A6A0B6E6_9LACT|nr:pitrilysin family protein [Lactococcus insecticola]GFH41029.1 peptidase M16 [Lactococcus insecticola]